MAIGETNSLPVLSPGKSDRRTDDVAIIGLTDFVDGHGRSVVAVANLVNAGLFRERIAIVLQQFNGIPFHNAVDAGTKDGCLDETSYGVANFQCLNWYRLRGLECLA